MTTVLRDDVRVTVGVDTHEDVHVAVALDQLGRWLGELSIPTHRGDFVRLLDWASEFGVFDRFGVEGTGSWGGGLSRWLRAEGLVVVEVDRPKRKTRRHGKSDTIDAEAAARAVLSGEATAVPKTGDGPVEMIRVLRLTRRSAVKNRTMTANQINALVTTAPDALRDQLRELTTRRRVAVAAKFRAGKTPTSVVEATRYALRELARRYQHLTEQIDRLDTQLDRLVAETAPDLVARVGVGTHTAAALLVTAGDNPERLTREGSFAHLTGSAPLDASSGKQQRDRLNRGGDRDANSALYQIALTRSSVDEATKLYLKRRIAEGKSKKEAFRCLKRYIAREVHKSLAANPPSGPHLMP
ncbi:MAG TPA: IS110 family transposase [Rubrobacteraceae bacterium]|nr:IS110 family transposase [Rubrobacteraceae bacterium]